MLFHPLDWPIFQRGKRFVDQSPSNIIPMRCSVGADAAESEMLQTGFLVSSASLSWPVWQPSLSEQHMRAIQSVGLAGVSNAAAAACTNPVDVVKVRMQMAGEGVVAKGIRSASRMNMKRAAADILRADGPQGFYRGLSPSLLREMSYSGIRLGLYEPIKEVLGATDPTQTPLRLKILAGGVTGAAGSVIANPFDLIKVRMQTASGGHMRYRSIGAAFAQISQEGGGICGLWRGTGPTVMRAALLTSSQVPTYDHVKHGMLNGGHMREGYLCHFFSSMCAGVVAAAVTSPIDLIKSRVMVQPVDPRTGRGTLYSGVADCLVRVVRTEGPLALYKGFHSQWLRIGPHTTVSLMIFEQLRRLAGMSYL